MMEFGPTSLFQHLHRSFRHLLGAIAFILFVLLIGTFSFTRLEHLSLMDSLYFTVVTLSTIGYGDITPTSHETKIFLIMFIPLGVGAYLYLLSAVSVTIFEGKMIEVFKMEQMQDKIKKMKNHVVLCGYGDVGARVASGLQSVVVVENRDASVEAALNAGYPIVEGTSTESGVLKKAGVERASAVIIALNSDPETVFTILTAKEMNPKAKIYARANRPDSVKKMKMAGAHNVVCVPEIAANAILCEFDSKLCKPLQAFD
ncbi:Calcium-gated potassium channel MthK [uncultured archaeon]|nr:Calcium-gated potassium channel MthK [uncultured archaeon]